MGKVEDFLALCKSMYACYVAYSHNNKWKAGKAVSFLCKTVEEFLNKKTGHAYDILVISMPPQHGKSMTITETLPSWYLINNPDKRVIEISYSEDFAQLFGRRNRQKLREFGKNFGVFLADSPNSNRRVALLYPMPNLRCINEVLANWFSTMAITTSSNNGSAY